MDSKVIEKALANLITEADVIHGQLMGKKHGFLSEAEKELEEEGSEEGEEIEEAMEAQEPTETAEQESAETPEEQAIEEEEGIEKHSFRKPSSKLADIFKKAAV